MDREPQPITQQQGTDDSWQVVLQAEDGDTLDPYDPGDTLECVVGRGPGLPALFSPAATWLDAPGASIVVAIDAADVEDLDPGLYPIDLYVARTTEGKRRPGWSGWWELTPAPFADGVAGTVYSSYQDLLDFAGDWLATSRPRYTQVNFLQARVKARRWLDQIILAHVPPTMASRGDLLYGLNLFGPAESRSRQVQAWLDADGLLVTLERTEIVSRKAIGIVCEDQIGTEDPDPWAIRAARYHAQAGNLVKGYIAEIDVDGDGVADYAFHCGQFKLRRD